MRIPIRKSLFGLFFLFTLHLFAQNVTISGYVKDEASGEELIGANIIVKELSKGVSSNVYGFYSLTLPKGKHNINVSYIGYTSKEIEVDLQGNMTMNFQLSASSNVINEIVLSDVKSDHNIKSVEISTIKLDPQKMKEIPVVLGEQDIIKSFTLQPGITTAREGANGFNVRGGKSDQNLILLDESSIFSSSHLFGFFSVFNSDVIKDATMYKGGIPSYYGGRLSSVLDIRQKEGNMKEYHGAGGIGVLSSRLMFEGPIVKNKGSFMVAGRRSYADLFLPLSSNPTLKDSRMYFYDLNAKANYILNDKNRLFLSGYFGRDVFGFSDRFNLAWGNTNFTLRWNHVFSPKLFSNASLVYSNYNYDLEIKDVFLWKSSVKDLSFKNDYNYYINDANTLKFGANVSRYEINLGDIEYDEQLNRNDSLLGIRTGIEPSVYVSHEVKFNTRLDFEYGLRLSGYLNVGDKDQPVAQYLNNKPIYWDSELEDYVTQTPSGYKTYDNNEIISQDFRLLPRLRLKYGIDETSSIKLGYNRMMQNLHLVSNATSSNPLNIWIPNNEYIDPEMADQISVGYFKNFNKNKYEFSAETYYKYLSNVIDYKDLPRLSQNPHIAGEILPGIGRAYGLELYFKKTSGKLTGWISYTLSRSELKIEGFGAEGEKGINNGDWYAAAHDKTHDLSITGVYKLSKRLTLSANFVFASGIPVNYPESSFTLDGVQYGHYNGLRSQHRLPIYHRIDVGATLKGKPKKWGETEWIFGIYNLYNRYNAASIAFIENEDTGQNQVEQTTYFGIIPSITWNFKF
ncbi:MAG: TonB-dependent receptor [Flavobacteriales bacterium]